MRSDALLARLNLVRKTGNGRWVCRCPAHDDRSPGLSVRELDDGCVLLHCCAGSAARHGFSRSLLRTRAGGQVTAACCERCLSNALQLILGIGCGAIRHQGHTILQCRIELHISGRAEGAT